MEILKIVLVVVFNIVAFLLMVLCFTQTRDSFYEKNRNRTKEGRMDNIIRGLFILLVLLAVGLYFV